MTESLLIDGAGRLLHGGDTSMVAVTSSTLETEPKNDMSKMEMAAYIGVGLSGLVAVAGITHAIRKFGFRKAFGFEGTIPKAKAQENALDYAYRGLARDGVDWREVVGQEPSQPDQ